MAKKIAYKFTAILELNPEKAGAWIASVFLEQPLDMTNDAPHNSIPDSTGSSRQSAWKNASAGKRWIKAQVLDMTTRKSVKMVVTEKNALDKPTKFVGVLEFKA